MDLLSLDFAFISRTRENHSRYPTRGAVSVGHNEAITDSVLCISRCCFPSSWHAISRGRTALKSEPRTWQGNDICSWLHLLTRLCARLRSTDKPPRARMAVGLKAAAATALWCQAIQWQSPPTPNPSSFCIKSIPISYLFSDRAGLVQTVSQLVMLWRPPYSLVSAITDRDGRAHHFQ